MSHVPEPLARQMFADYLRLGSLRLVAEKYGRKRQNVHRMFKRRGWQMLSNDKWRPRRQRGLLIRCEGCGQVSQRRVGDSCAVCP